MDRDEQEIMNSRAVPVTAVLALLVGACGSDTPDAESASTLPATTAATSTTVVATITTPSTTALATTSTGVPGATAADVAVVERYIAAREVSTAYWSPDARIRYEGQTFGLFAHAPRVSVDWDGDGSTTNADTLADTFAFMTAMNRTTETVCEASGVEVVCTEWENDPFFELVGRKAGPFTHAFVVDDGLIVEYTHLRPEATPELDEAWLSQYVIFEQWVLETHPDQYEELFNGPCCRSDMIFLPDTVDAHAALVTEWSTAE
jgi:hypothetical protein